MLRTTQLLVALLFHSQLAGADFTTYNLGVYGSESWTNTQGEEYDSNFWAHRYWNPETDPARDECRHEGCQHNTVTHTGKDYAVNNAGDVDKVRSHGFGQIVNQQTAYGQVSIRHLTSCGEYFTANLLHSADIDPHIIVGTA